ncbi:MAG: hypothetical protein WDM94_14365 [Bauldia sp.]
MSAADEVSPVTVGAVSAPVGISSRLVDTPAATSAVQSLARSMRPVASAEALGLSAVVPSKNFS